MPAGVTNLRDCERVELVLELLLEMQGLGPLSADLGGGTLAEGRCGRDVRGEGARAART